MSCALNRVPFGVVWSTQPSVHRLEAIPRGAVRRVKRVIGARTGRNRERQQPSCADVVRGASCSRCAGCRVAAIIRNSGFASRLIANADDSCRSSKAIRPVLRRSRRRDRGRLRRRSAIELLLATRTCARSPPKASSTPLAARTRPQIAQCQGTHAQHARMEARRELTIFQQDSNNLRALDARRRPLRAASFHSDRGGEPWQNGWEMRNPAPSPRYRLERTTGFEPATPTFAR